MPQKSATTTNTNSPSLFIIEPYNSPPPSTEGFFMPPQMPPFNGGLFHAPTKAPLAHHAEHPSTPCRTPFHIMQSMLPHPPNAPSRHTPAEKEPIIPSQTSKKVPRPHVGTPSSLTHWPQQPFKVQFSIFNSPPPCRGGGLGGRGSTPHLPPPHRSCPRCRRCTPPPSGR